MPDDGLILQEVLAQLRSQFRDLVRVLEEGPYPSGQRRRDARLMALGLVDGERG